MAGISRPGTGDTEVRIQTVLYTKTIVIVRLAMKLIYKFRMVLVVLVMFAMFYACSSGSDGECFWCDGTGSKDCSLCDDGVSDCSLCADGVTSRGTTCTYCNGEGSKVCTFCNGQGWSTCNQCNGTGKD